MSAEIVRNYVESLANGQKNLLFGLINLNLHRLEISWDFDQVLIMSEIPVLDFVDKDLGTHYAGRKIKGWNSIAKWISEDGIKTRKEADEYEDWVWTEPKIVREAPPNRCLQAFSFVAWQRGIPQSMTTTRPPKLAEVTYKQVEMHFPWLAGYVNQRSPLEAGVPGTDYKAIKVAERSLVSPNLVHLDDSMVCMRKILKLNPDVDIIGFPAPEEEFSDMVGGRHIFFSDISMFESLLNYSPQIPSVAQS